MPQRIARRPTSQTIYPPGHGIQRRTNCLIDFSNKNTRGNRPHNQDITYPKQMTHKLRLRRVSPWPWPTKQASPGTLEIRNTRKKLIQMPRLVTPKSITQCLLLYKLGGTLDRGIEPEEIIQSSSSTGKRWRCLMCQCLGWWCWCCWWCLSVRRRELSLWRAIRRSWARAPGQFSSTTIPLTSAAADSGSSNLAFVST